MLPGRGPEKVSTCAALRWHISVELEMVACIGQRLMMKHSVPVPEAVKVQMVAILCMQSQPMTYPVLTAGKVRTL